MKEIDNFYLNKAEPDRSCLLALRDLILRQDPNITAAWKYGMPFFCYKGKMFCYLWLHKKEKLPYIGMVEGKRLNHPNLIQEDRARMKIMLIDPNKNLPVRTLEKLILDAIDLYRSGKVKH
jgi:hypothetical protein